MKSTQGTLSNMKGEGEYGHHNWLVSLYQSVFQYIIGYLFLMLNVFQEFFKTGMEKSISPIGRYEDNVAISTMSGTGRIPPAGELFEFSSDTEAALLKDHTILDLPSKESLGSTEKPSEIRSFPSTYTLVEPTGDQSKNTLVIKNLPFKYKPADLEALLVEHQAKPKNVRLLRDDAGRFSGMAFIRCVSKEEAQRLIFSMNDLDIGGRNIQVEFKMKKKKKGGSLRTSSEDASGLSSSSEELPVNKLRISAETVNEKASLPSQTLPSQQQQPSSSFVPPPPGLSVRKLAVSAEHSFNDKFRKPPQMRRKSTSILDSSSPYAHSALSKAQAALPSIRPVRQPVGPDGKSNGFSVDYRHARLHHQ